ncbi:MAG: hypothetical protein AAFX79_00650 [Planctomycetota bacterium]
MTGTPLDLLKLVGAGARLLGAGRAEQPGGADFETALAAATEGGAGTGRVVVAGPELGVDLTPSQLERLAQATDRAEARGAETAAVLIDGMMIRVDVASRVALESVPIEDGALADIDAVVSAGPERPSGDDLLRALGRSREAGGSAA